MSLLEFVNIKQGTKSSYRYSNGNTLPMTQLPFAMAGFAPQTDSAVKNWFYNPDSRSLEGVRLTHQPSPWIGDYGALTLLPQNERIFTEPDKRWSGYRPEEAVLRPDYMRLYFLRSGCELCLVPTDKGAYIRLNYGFKGDKWFSVFPEGGNFRAELDTENAALYGWTDQHSNDKAENFKMYFVLKFNKGDINAESTVICDSGAHIGISGEKAECRLAVSYISTEQALINLDRDTAPDGFDGARKMAAELWEERLSLISVKTDNEKLLRTFYSCLYRVFLYPHKAYETDANGKEIHYCPYDGKIRPGKRYTDNGFWDTYRTVFPLFSIIAPQDYKAFAEGFIQDYRDCGWLPRWPSIGEVGCMPSTLIDAVIADGAVKGIIRGELLETALRGMLHHSVNESADRRFGRNGAKAYRKYGYVPNDVEEQSVNLTLDAAYGDFCIAETAEISGDTETAMEYRKSSKNYKNIFDTESGFMRGRDSSGNMRPDFDPFAWGGEYTEASAWQTTFAVQHDIDGLAELFGGVPKLIERLDDFFKTPPVYNVGAYDAEIHEMSEMAAVDFGQCAISNQPSFHIPYIYAYLGEREKSVYWVDKICNELFSPETDGFPGDEDNGAMSAWFIFSALGFYPLCPGKAEYINIGRTLFESAGICGKRFDPAAQGKFIPHGFFKCSERAKGL